MVTSRLRKHFQQRRRDPESSLMSELSQPRGTASEPRVGTALPCLARAGLTPHRFLHERYRGCNADNADGPGVLRVEPTYRLWAGIRIGIHRDNSRVLASGDDPTAKQVGSTRYQRRGSPHLRSCTEDRNPRLARQSQSAAQNPSNVKQDRPVAMDAPTHRRLVCRRQRLICEMSRYRAWQNQNRARQRKPARARRRRA